MQARKLKFACPLCGSADVFYSCTPSCCFNHVCGACRATFEPVTRATGGTLAGVLPPDPPPDSTDPTAACARCGSTAVYMTSEGGQVCGDCGALLGIELTGIAPG